MCHLGRRVRCRKGLPRCPRCRDAMSQVLAWYVFRIRNVISYIHTYIDTYLDTYIDTYIIRTAVLVHVSSPGIFAAATVLVLLEATPLSVCAATLLVLRHSPCAPVVLSRYPIWREAYLLDILVVLSGVIISGRAGVTGPPLDSSWGGRARAVLTCATRLDSSTPCASGLRPSSHVPACIRPPPPVVRAAPHRMARHADPVRRDRRISGRPGAA